LRQYSVAADDAHMLHIVGGGASAGAAIVLAVNDVCMRADVVWPQAGL